jgi:nucleoside-diphosphate kinase
VERQAVSETAGRSGHEPAAARPNRRRTMEQTFVMIKPDGVRRGLVGECIRRFEAKGLKLVELKLLTPSRDLAESHYGVHRDRPFFAGVVEFITSGPVAAMVLEGPGAIAAVRQLVGATRPWDAAPGSIRADYALEVGENIVHASDGPDTAASEIALWFAK